MLLKLKSELKNIFEQSLSRQFSNIELPSLDLDVPADKTNGNFSTNIALKSAKILKKSPQQIANDFVGIFQKSMAESSLAKSIEKIEVKGAGFINIHLSKEVYFQILYDVLKQKHSYGQSGYGQDKKVQIEFVSANPTGPLSVAHARQAAVGDALANVLNFIGFKAFREYYVNDEGNQINLLGDSVRIRAEEILTGQELAEQKFSDDHYRGEYIKDVARDFIKVHAIKTLEDLKTHGSKASQYAVDTIMAIIQKELSDFGVKFDIWSYQSRIATNQTIEAMLVFLKSKGLAYEKEGALWFETTKFGDDKDRVLKKSDGSYTYLTPDIVYHKDKFDRGFEFIMNIWGPDHHGYIPRIKASVQAMGQDPKTIEVLIVQLATIFRNGQAVSMSTRRGQYISLQEVMDEVGVDAARYFFLMRHISGHLEFDLDLAKKQSAENPVFYIQYGHARVHSVNKKAREAGIKWKETGLSRLQEEEEFDLIKKLGSFEEALLQCHHQLDPYPLVSYLHELAIAFHRFYDKCRIIDESDKELSAERLTLVNASGVVLANGLKLLGMSAPETM